MIKRFWYVLAIAALLILSYLGWRYYTNHHPQKPPAFNDMQVGLLTNNAAYRDALAALNRGDFTEAERLFKLALESDLIQREKDFVTLGLTLTYAQERRYDEAVSTLKQMVARADSDSFIKSFALQQLGTMAKFHPEDTGIIRPLIFTGDPYERYLVDGKATDTSERELLKHALTYNPNLILANIYVARWYAEQLPNVSPEIEPLYREEVAQHVSAGDKGLDEIKQYKLFTAIYQVVVYHVQKGFVAQTLDANGDKRLGESRKYFIEAINEAVNPEEKAYALFSSAISLSWKSQGQEAVIHELLSQIYNDPTLRETRYFHNLVVTKNPNDPRLPRVPVLAKIDPDFGTYLKSIGWSESELEGGTITPGDSSPQIRKEETSSELTNTQKTVKNSEDTKNSEAGAPSQVSSTSDSLKLKLTIIILAGLGIAGLAWFLLSRLRRGGDGV